jgi:Flp pilus assembly protein TadD
MTDRTRELLAALGLATSVACLYLLAADNGFVYDDHEVIEVQPRPDGPGDLVRLFAEPHFRGLPYYRPVVRASLLAQKALHGERASLFHAANAFLAGAAAAAAFALLRSPALGIAAAPAWIAAALFAAHPVASSAVYPIASGRETLLPAVLILATVAAWLRGRRRSALLALAGALFAKEQAIVTPLLLLLADACRLAGDAPPLRREAASAWIARHAPVVAIAIAYLAIRRSVLGPTDYELGDPLGAFWSLAFGVQVALAPFATLHYEPELATWLSPLRLGAALALLAALVALARAARAPALAAAFFWIGWFVVTQLPTANLLRQEARFDERYAFLALLAFPAVAAASVSALRGRALRLALAAFAAIAASLAAVSAQRAVSFRDDAAFAAQWLRTNPAAPEAHHLLAVLAAQQGRLEAAVAHYEDALRHAPDSPDLLTNLGVALAQLGRDAEARGRLEQALRIDPGHPEALSALGALWGRAGRLEEAIDLHRAAVRAAPRLAAAHANLGAALARLGRFAEAEAALREALRLDPDFADARRNLAAVVAARARDEADAPP